MVLAIGFHVDLYRPTGAPEMSPGFAADSDSQTRGPEWLSPLSSSQEVVMVEGHDEREEYEEEWV